jgi:DnaJ family protein A protein 2
MGGGGHHHHGEEDSEPVDTQKFYDLCGVEKDATTEQIKKAFRKKALRAHPDKGGDPEIVSNFLTHMA